MSTDSSTWVEVAVLLLAVLLSAAVGFFVIQRLRARGRQMKMDMADSPVFADDRAHNLIRLARSELELLRREGREVPRAGSLLDEAEQRLARRENVDAVRLARNAHDLLVSARAAGGGNAPAVASVPSSPGPTSPAARPDRVAEERPPPVDLLKAPAAPPEPELPAGSRPPKNRMEAHFQMTLLVEELAPGKKGGTPPAGWSDAEALRGQAQRAYSKGDYTEALRLALRGRRRLGTRLETLPPPKVAAVPEPVPVAQAPSPPRTGPSEVEDGPSPCPKCGRPGRAGDQFCRSCGASRKAASCPRCQGPTSVEDTFCGRCGSPLT